jgi:hypothetical protein
VYLTELDELHVGGRGDTHSNIYQQLDPDYENNDRETWNGYFNSR